MNRVLLSLLIVGMLTWPASAATKIGIVDGERLFDEYPKAQQATKKIAEAQEELKNTITDSEKAYNEFEKEKKTEAQKLTKQKELQLKIDQKAESTKKMIEKLSLGLENDIVNSIKKIADSKGLETVLDKRAVLVGGVDITEEVIAELKKKSSIAKSQKK